MDIRQFLVEAKQNTYASEGDGGERRLVDGSKQLTYELDGFRYDDVYRGFNPFEGMETVKEEGVIVFSMLYRGQVIDDVISEKEVYGFLKAALRAVTPDLPFRGPASFNEGNFEYTHLNRRAGSGFMGHEEISFRGRKVYELDYEGSFS